MSGTEAKVGNDVPAYAFFVGAMGATFAMIFSACGAAYGTAKSGTGIAAMAVMRPDLIMKVDSRIRRMIQKTES
jgi:V-type H+-transporting ATPase proteolipid subunit